MELEAKTSVIDHGYNYELLGKLARLGIVFDKIEVAPIFGHITEEPTFIFVDGYPLGRARNAARYDASILDDCVDDAHALTYEAFAEKYPSLGPY